MPNDVSASLERNKKTIFETSLRPFIKDSGYINSLRDVDIKVDEVHKASVENIFDNTRNGTMLPFFIDFYIIYEFHPSNAILNLFRFLKITKTVDQSYFRFEDDKIRPIAEPEIREYFERHIHEKFRQQVKGKGGFCTFNPTEGKAEF